MALLLLRAILYRYPCGPEYAEITEKDGSKTTMSFSYYVVGSSRAEYLAVSIIALTVPPITLLTTMTSV